LLLLLEIYNAITLEFTEYSIGTDMQRSGSITNSTGIETHVNDEVLHLRQTASVAVVEQKAASATGFILAQIALGSPSGFATFDDLLTVTVGTLDGNESHGPRLVVGRCEMGPSVSSILVYFHF
jgi:hypothetical protein